MTRPSDVLIAGGCIYIAFVVILAAAMRLDSSARWTWRSQAMLALMLAIWPVALVSALARMICNRLGWCKR